MKRIFELSAVFVGLLLVGSSAMAALTDDLLLYYSFDDGSGTVVTDHSGNGFDGTIFDFDKVDWSDGKFGKSLQTSAKGWEKEDLKVRTGRVEVQHDLGDHEALSFSLWFFPTIDSGWNYLADFRPTGSWFARDGAQNIKLDGQGEVPSGDYPRDEWVHLVVLADASSTTYYINGQKAGTPGGAAKRNISNSLHIGSRFSKNESFLTHLDDWAIWTRILTEDEIAEVAKGPVIGLGTAVDPTGKLATAWATIKRVR